MTGALKIWNGSAWVIAATPIGRGNSFPGSPVSGDLFWRTDLGMEFFYDGTRWLSKQLFTMDFEEVVNGITTSDTRLEVGPPWLGGRDVWVTRIEVTSHVATTNSGSAYWTWQLMSNNGSTWANVGNGLLSTAALAANVWVRHGADVNAVYSAAQGATLTCLKTGTPGALTCMVTLYYRIIAT